MSLMKTNNVTVHHFALRVQQLVEKGWCNENAATINLKNIEIFTKGLAKKTSPTKDKLNIYQHYLNHQHRFTHLFDMLILKTSLMKKQEQTT